MWVVDCSDAQQAVFEEMVRHHEVDWTKVIIGQTHEFSKLGADNPGSFRFILSHQLDRLKPGCRPLFLHTARLSDIDRLSAEDGILANQIDLVTIGIGSDGQIGFLNRGSNREDRHVYQEVIVDDESRRWFAEHGEWFKNPSLIPTTGWTMSLNAISKASRVVCVATNDNCSEVLRSICSGEFDHECPASNMQRWDNVVIHTSMNSGTGLH